MSNLWNNNGIYGQDEVTQLAGIVMRYTESIEELNTKVVALEAKQMKTELIVFGVDVEAEKSPVEHAKSFLENKLSMESVPDISYAYWKGKSEHKPLVIVFKNSSAKGSVFSHILNLKGKKNSSDRAYRVMDHLPDEMMEPKLRHMQIIKDNQKLVGASQMTMEMKRGQLQVTKQVYQKKDPTPFC